MRVGWRTCSKCRGKKKKKKDSVMEACSASEVYAHACIFYRTPASLSASFKRPSVPCAKKHNNLAKADIRKTQERPISCQIYVVIRASKPSRSLSNAKHAPRPAPTRSLNQMPNSLQVKRGWLLYGKDMSGRFCLRGKRNGRSEAEEADLHQPTNRKIEQPSVHGYARQSLLRGRYSLGRDDHTPPRTNKSKKIETPSPGKSHMNVVYQAAFIACLDHTHTHTHTHTQQTHTGARGIHTCMPPPPPKTNHEYRGDPPTSQMLHSSNPVLYKASLC